MDQKLFEYISETFGVMDLSEFIQKVHSSNPGTDLGYHNNTHMLVVAYLALEIINMEAQILETELLLNDRYDVVVAGLMHDYAHQGHGPDAQNIEIAINEVKRLHEVGELPPMCNVEEVIRLIRVTEYPFIHTPTDLKQFALRDADLLYVLFSDLDIPNVVDGLLLEMYGDSEITQERIENQKKFYASVTWYTRTGQMVFNKQFPDYIKYLESRCADVKNHS